MSNIALIWIKLALSSTLLALFASLIATSCAPQLPMAAGGIPLEQAAPIPPGMAALILVNDSGWTLLQTDQEVTDRGQRIASLPRQTYMRLAITPGSHELRPWPATAGQVVRLNAEPGHTYYIVVAYRPAVSWLFRLAGTPLVIQELSETEALRLMQEVTSLQP